MPDAVFDRAYEVRVVDLPQVKEIRVTYRYPKWTGLQTVSEEHGGDLRALEGTQATLSMRTLVTCGDEALAFAVEGLPVLVVGVPPAACEPPAACVPPAT